MRLGIHQVLGILVSFYVWASLARSLHETKHFLLKERYFDNGNEFNHAALKPRNASELVVRDVDVDMLDDSPPGISCRTLCSAASNPVKHDWRDFNPRSPLEKRFDVDWPPEGDDAGRDKFMKNACNGLTPEQAIVPLWAESGSGYASAVTTTLGNSKFRFGMQRICGCTMLFVVSRKRVYLAHYWEDVSFGKEDGADYKLQFAAQVTNFLKSGYKAPGGPAQDSLQQHAADFQDHSTLYAYLISPDASEDAMNPSPKFLYPNKIKSMASTVASILGVTTDKVIQKTYVAVDSKEGAQVLSDTATGRMIFDYDPRGGPAGTEIEPYAAWRILWQREQIAADQWNRAPAA